MTCPGLSSASPDAISTSPVFSDLPCVPPLPTYTEPDVPDVEVPLPNEASPGEPMPAPLSTATGPLEGDDELPILTAPLSVSDAPLSSTTSPPVGPADFPPTISTEAPGEVPVVGPAWIDTVPAAPPALPEERTTLPERPSPAEGDAFPLPTLTFPVLPCPEPVCMVMSPLAISPGPLSIDTFPPYAIEPPAVRVMPLPCVPAVSPDFKEILPAETWPKPVDTATLPDPSDELSPVRRRISPEVPDVPAFLLSRSTDPLEDPVLWPLDKRKEPPGPEIALPAETTASPPVSTPSITPSELPPRIWISPPESPSPPVIIVEPPTAPSDHDVPAAITTSPPSPTSPSPTDNSIIPPDPPVAPPVTTASLPDDPAVEVPVVR